MTIFLRIYLIIVSVSGDWTLVRVLSLVWWRCWRGRVACLLGAAIQRVSSLRVHGRLAWQVWAIVVMCVVSLRVSKRFACRPCACAFRSTLGVDFFCCKEQCFTSFQEFKDVFSKRILEIPKSICQCSGFRAPKHFPN